MASAKPKVYDYGSVFISLENCTIPAEKLEKTPSASDGLNGELETDLRIVGCEYIQTAGILLKLPQVRKQVVSHANFNDCALITQAFSPNLCRHSI
jgi:hypothetical protein